MEENIKVDLPEEIDAGELFGNMDENLRLLKETMDVEIVQRNGSLVLNGKDKEKAADVIRELAKVIEAGESLDAQKVAYITSLSERGMKYSEGSVQKDVICYTHTGKPLKPKTIGQKNYVKAIREKEVVFGIGPAGTGKTYIAVAMAVTAYKKREVQKIILTRPAVEAGERLGFLPGDLQSKVDPYLRPLYDALFDMLGADTYQKYLERGNIEVAPLAYMRGRTLDDSFIILDEAQNTSREQMKMFLTRIGFGSKVVITGDITQIDLRSGTESGLINAARILNDVEEIRIIHLSSDDVVRHPLVQKIIERYERQA